MIENKTSVFLMGVFLSTSFHNQLLQQQGLLFPRFLLSQANILSEQFDDQALEEQLIEGMDQGMKGNYLEAIQIFSRLIKDHPKYADAYYNRGIAKAKLAEKVEAIADYNQAIQINVNFAEAYEERGNIWLNLGDKTQAIHDFQKAAQLYKQQANTISYDQVIKNIQSLQKKLK